MGELLGLTFIFVTTAIIAVIVGAITTGTIRFICLGLVALFAVVGIRISTHRNATDAFSPMSSQVSTISTPLSSPEPPFNAPVAIGPANPSRFSTPAYIGPTPQDVPRLTDKLPSPFETFSFAEAISFLIAVLTLSVIFNDYLKEWRRPVGFGLLALFSVWLIAFLQETRTSQNQELANPEALAALQSILTITLQQAEKLPPPLNEPSLLVLLGVYLLGLSFILSLALKIFISSFGRIDAAFEDKGELRRIKNERKEISDKLSKEINDREEIRLLMRRSVLDLREYYEINKAQTVKSFWFSVVLISAGTSIIAATIYFALTRPDLPLGLTIGSTISGIFLEFIGGTALLLYDRNMQCFNRFFNALTKDQDTLLAVELCENLKDMNYNVEYMQATKDVIGSLMSRATSQSLPDQDAVQKNSKNGSQDSKKE